MNSSFRAEHHVPDDGNLFPRAAGLVDEYLGSSLSDVTALAVAAADCLNELKKQPDYHALLGGEDRPVFDNLRNGLRRTVGLLRQLQKDAQHMAHHKGAEPRRVDGSTSHGPGRRLGRPATFARRPRATGIGTVRSNRGFHTVECTHER